MKQHVVAALFLTCVLGTISQVHAFGTDNDIHSSYRKIMIHVIDLSSSKNTSVVNSYICGYRYIYHLAEESNIFTEITHLSETPFGAKVYYCRNSITIPNDSSESKAIGLNLRDDALSEIEADMTTVRIAGDEQIATLEVITHPSSAEVFTGGEELYRGQTPLILKLPIGTKVKLIVRKFGYLTFQEAIAIDKNARREMRLEIRLRKLE